MANSSENLSNYITGAPKQMADSAEFLGFFFFAGAFTESQKRVVVVGVVYNEGDTVCSVSSPFLVSLSGLTLALWASE